MVFTASGADNENLRAQAGLFMLYSQQVNSWDQPFVPTSYKDLALKSVLREDKWPVLSRVLLPTREARRVMVFLANAGITAGSMFPGLWGVAREMEERWLLSNEPTEYTPFANEVRERIRNECQGG
jgi:hypothetical protein